MMDYSFKNKRRDLADVFAAVRKDEPRFISLFETGAEALSSKHEYLNTPISMRGFDAVVLSATKDVLDVSAPGTCGVEAGTTAVLHGSSALFEVTSVTDGGYLRLRLISLNGAEVDLPALRKGSFDIVHSKDLGATSAVTEWNATQPFRKEIVLSSNSLDTDLYGSVDNQLNRKTAFALADLARYLNRAALFGYRTEESPGGLYYFATESGAPCIDARERQLDELLINEAAQKVVRSGGEPQTILCSIVQARSICRAYTNRIQISRSDDRRGAYVAMIVNEINGRGMTIIADPDIPYGDVWVLDPSCFKLVYRSGKRITDSDTTPEAFDGIIRTIEGEVTFEFRNIEQRCCRIKKRA